MEFKLCGAGTSAPSGLALPEPHGQSSQKGRGPMTEENSLARDQFSQLLSEILLQTRTGPRFWPSERFHHEIWSDRAGFLSAAICLAPLTKAQLFQDAWVIYESKLCLTKMSSFRSEVIDRLTGRPEPPATEFARCVVGARMLATFSVRLPARVSADSRTTFASSLTAPRRSTRLSWVEDVEVFSTIFASAN